MTVAINVAQPAASDPAVELCLPLADMPGYSVFHTPRWVQVVSDTYGYATRCETLTDRAGATRAGLIVAEIDDVLGRRLASFPFSDFFDPLVDNEADWRALIDPLLARGLPMSMRVLHNRIPLSDTRFVRTKRARWHRIDVSTGPDVIWNRLDESARRAIRKARKSDVSIVYRTDRESVRAYFGLHLGVRKYKYRLLAQPWLFFENIWSHWIAHGNGGVFLALDAQGLPVAGTLTLRWGDTLYYKFNASSANALQIRPNDLILWSIINEAHEQGCRFVDLGLSDWDQEGLIAYKRKYATEEGEISFLQHTPPGYAPPRGAQQLKTHLGELTRLMTEPSVPDAITERAGDTWYRYFV
jgi:CelD/BcsL family acetyltransferase involved in cellulose biosynthesis